MRTLLLLLCIAAASPAAWAQKLLTSDEIIKALPGVWDMERSDPPGSERALHCGKYKMRISFETDSKRGLVYISEHLAKPEPGETREDNISRAPVAVLGNAIRIQYDGEKRLDDKGKPVVWFLVMPDKDTFLWHRADWAPGGFTAESHRCPDTNLVG